MVCVHGEVVSDGGAEAGELTDSIEFVVMDGNDERCFYGLFLDVRLLQTDGQSEIKAVNQ